LPSPGKVAEFVDWRIAPPFGLGNAAHQLRYWECTNESRQAKGQGCPESVLRFVAQNGSRATTRCWLLRNRNKLNSEKIGIIIIFLWMGYGCICELRNHQRGKKASRCSEYRNSEGPGTERRSNFCGTTHEATWRFSANHPAWDVPHSDPVPSPRSRELAG
jgi:hypothetical protein